MSAARSRLLTTATRLFYTEGLHSVGVDRIITEAQVTRATLYKHFPSKDHLIVAYLTQTDEVVRAGINDARSQDVSADEVVRTISRAITDDIQREGFRGCAFLNAAAEFPDPTHPVHQAVLDHRQWYLETMTALFSNIGRIDPGPAARHFVMLRDGAMTAGHLTDPELVEATFSRGIEGLLTYRSREPTP